MSESIFSKCPNCDAPFPVFVRVESDTVDKLPTDLTLRCTCYQCEAHVDLTLKLGDRDEPRRRVS